MTPEGAWRNAAPSTLASTGPAPHEQLVFTHPEAVAAWGLSSHEAGELQGDDAVGPGGHGADSDPRRRLTTPWSSSGVGLAMARQSRPTAKAMSGRQFVAQ